MEMRAAGFSFSKIAKTLNAEGAPAPRRVYKGRIQDYWVPSSIKAITKNELYHGVRLWNRTQKVLNPSDGTKISRTKPQSEWVRVEVPHLQIVSDELWQQVQQVNQRTKDKYYGRRQGGFNRSEASRTYLFSGLMTCGLCGGRFNVIIGGHPSKVRYGCRNHRFRNTCTNKVTIRRNRLEPQLIAAISKNLLDARLEQQRVQDFSAQLKAAIEVEEKLAAEAGSQAPKLKTERTDLDKQASHLVDAIRQHGCSPYLSAELTKVESRMAEIDRLLTAKPTSKPTTFTDEQIAEFLRQECQNFCDALAGDAEFARREIQKRIRSLVLTPDGQVLDVSGDVALLGTGDVLVESPMEGIAQHYIGASISLAGVRLDPSLPVAA